MNNKINDAEHLVEAVDMKSAFAQGFPGWPPAQLSKRERESLPRRPPHPIDHAQKFVRNDRNGVAMKQTALNEVVDQYAGLVDIPETWIGQLLYIFRWKRRQKMIYKATIDIGRKVTELELFGNVLHEPNREITSP